MRRFALIVVGLLLVAVTFTLPTFTARAASASRFEYLRLTPGLPTHDPATGQPLVGVSPNRQGYMACMASRPTTEKCREFVAEWQSQAMDVALATLGNEGWELVSVIDETVNLGSPKGLTYIFKRAVR